MRNTDGDWEVESHGKSINFNFCHYAENTCDNQKNAFAFMKDHKCLALTSDEPKAEIAEAVERPDKANKS